MKNGKVAETDDMCVEQIKQFDPEAKNVTLEHFN